MIRLKDLRASWLGKCSYARRRRYASGTQATPKLELAVLVKPRPGYQPTTTEYQLSIRQLMGTQWSL
jgi:hypothetical protein